MNAIKSDSYDESILSSSARISTSNTGLVASNQPDAYSSIPDAMKAAPRWLVWRAEPQEGKKPRKVPFYVNGQRRRGSLDTPEDQRRLVNFHMALSALNRGGYTGLGFALGTDGCGSYWQGIDLDGFDGKGSAQKPLADTLPGYVEWSPSGKGVHAIGVGRPFRCIGSSPNDGVEAYCEGRYFTVTGNAYRPDSDLEDISEFVTTRLHPIVEKRSKPVEGELRMKPLPIRVTTNNKSLRDTISALGHLPSEDYHLWIAFGMALKHSFAEQGLEPWLAWSSSYSGYDEEEALAKWKTFNAREIHYQSILYYAQKSGWKNPGYGADLEPREPGAEYQYSTVLPRPVEFVVDGFIPRGIVTVAGASGVGKSSSLIPLLCQVAHLGGENLRPILRRKVVFVTEDPDQAERALCAFRMRHPRVTEEEIKEWFHIFNAVRLGPVVIADQVAKWREAFRYQAGVEQNNFIIEPVIVLDTANANIELENENDNAEVGRAISALKTAIDKGCMWIITHTTKTSRNDSDELTSRGAGAWDADSNATLFLVKGEKDLKDKRFLKLGKRRFEPDYLEMEFNSQVDRFMVFPDWGGEQMCHTRWSTPIPILDGNGHRQQHEASLSYPLNSGSRL